MNKILLCNYIAGAGKDCFADYLVEKYGFIKLSFAQPIYNIAEDIFGMKTKDRKLLQAIGQGMREINPNVWLDYAFARANKIIKWGGQVVIPDGRHINEYERAKAEGFTPIKITCERDIAIGRAILRDGHCDINLLDNEAESNLRNVRMMEISNNNSLEDFYKKIDFIMRNNI